MVLCVEPCHAGTRWTLLGCIRYKGGVTVRDVGSWQSVGISIVALLAFQRCIRLRWSFWCFHPWQTWGILHVLEKHVFQGQLLWVFVFRNAQKAPNRQFEATNDSSTIRSTRRYTMYHRLGTHEIIMGFVCMVRVCPVPLQCEQTGGGNCQLLFESSVDKDYLETKIRLWYGYGSCFSIYCTTRSVPVTFFFPYQHRISVVFTKLICV